MIIFSSAHIYVTSAKTAKEQLVRLDAVIQALMDTMLKAALNENLTEYVLDDGQTKIECKYRGVESIKKSIFGLEQLRQLYINRLNGRGARLMDHKSLAIYFGNNGRH